MWTQRTVPWYMWVDASLCWTTCVRHCGCSCCLRGGGEAHGGQISILANFNFWQARIHWTWTVCSQEVKVKRKTFFYYTAESGSNGWMDDVITPLNVLNNIIVALLVCFRIICDYIPLEVRDICRRVWNSQSCAKVYILWSSKWLYILVSSLISSKRTGVL